MPDILFTDLPVASSGALDDIYCCVQGGTTSTQITAQKLLTLMQDNIVLSYAGDPNGNVAGTIYQLLYDTTNKELYVCSTSGAAAFAVWTLIGSNLLLPANGGTGVSSPTANTLPVANGSSAFSFLGPLDTGQVLGGVTGGAPIPTTITSGANMALTAGVGTFNFAVNNNDSAVAPPTVNDDGSQGYSACSIWTDLTNDDSYICVDATIGAAIWKLATTQQSDSIYGNFYITNNSTAYDIQTTNIDLGCDGFSENIGNGITFAAGSNGNLDNAAAVDQGGSPNVVRIPATGSNLSIGDIVTIQGTTNYNGVFSVVAATADTFDIEIAYNAETFAGTEVWYVPDRGIIQTAGVYLIQGSLSCLNGAGTDTFEFSLYSGTTRDVPSISKRKFSSTDVGVISITTMIDAQVDDIIWLAVRNAGGTSDLTLQYASFAVVLT